MNEQEQLKKEFDGLRIKEGYVSPKILDLTDDEKHAYNMALDDAWELLSPHLISSDEIKREVIYAFNMWVVNRYDGGFASDVIEEYLTQSKEGGE